MAIDLEFPKEFGQSSERAQVKRLADYMYSLTEQLNFVLNNLDTDNFSTETAQALRTAQTQAQKAVAEAERIEQQQRKKAEALGQEIVASADLVRKSVEVRLEAVREEKPLRSMELKPEEWRQLRGFTFVTSRPEIIVLNLDETQSDEAKIPKFEEIKKRAEEQGTKVCRLYGSLEMDVAELTDEEAAEFTEGLNITEPGRERLIEEAYKVLGLISFFTCGPDEVRAWTLHDGENAVDAAGAIHSDLARGFIRAQVVAFDDYAAHANSFDECRKAGCLRLEGKEYIVKDGDMIEIRFNV